MGSHWSCPRAPVAAPTGTSEITRDPAVGSVVPGSVRALSSLGAVADWLDGAPSGGRTEAGGDGSGRLATLGDAGSGARFAGGEEVVVGAGSGARVTGGGGAAAVAGSGAGMDGGGGAGAAISVSTDAAAGAWGGLTPFGGCGSCWRDTFTVTRGSDGIHAWRHTSARPAATPSTTRAVNSWDWDRARVRRLDMARARPRVAWDRP